MKHLLTALRIMTGLTVLTGFLYPGIVTGLCQLCFRHQANGSLIVRDGRVVGSILVGQNFTRPEYFHPRPSAAGTEGYDASASSGSNLGPTSRKLMDRVKADIEKFRLENPAYHGAIPADLVTASGSGLDPDISPASAEAQAARIAKSRNLPIEAVNRLISKFKEPPFLGLLGDPRVNVLRLNIALDEYFPLSVTPPATR
jgi:potassium-transporting ATPase KdpC subunit